MSNELYKIIARHIETGGPISVAAYMDLCLMHPQYGYYRTRDPLGAAGDFITAPEISQLFGEMIGIWIADKWQSLGAPEKIILCELGPGRGTLMADIMRVVRKIPALETAVQVHLVEMNEVLIAEQAKKVTAKWHDTLDGVPTDAPIIIIGNEFLDALPFHQAVNGRDGWHERVIGLQEGKLTFGMGKSLSGSDLPVGDIGAIYEYSTARENIWQEILARVAGQGGGALLVDYGFDRAQLGSTFQAVSEHRFADALENPGTHDLTSHVDFYALKKLSPQARVITQGEFLSSMGIEVRAEQLSTLNPDKRDVIYEGMKRLVHPDQMGNLFKVIEV